MISLEDKKESVILISEAVESGARKSKACEIIGISLRTCQRREFNSKPDQRKGGVKSVYRKLSDDECQEIIDISCSKRFKDLTPHEIVPILAVEGCYMAFEATFYRVLRKNDMLHHCGDTQPPEQDKQTPGVKSDWT